MKVYKFGGGSIKEASDIKNLAFILREEKKPIFVVISALKKTTNALEKLTNLYFQKENYELQLQEVYNFHLSIILELFPKEHSFFEEINKIFDKLRTFLLANKSLNYNFIYDQLVSFGELFSTKIISEYLNFIKIKNTWLDARKYIKTNDNYREAQVNWEETQKLILTLNKKKSYLTQGFLGSDKEGFTTTLGRESSDYSASIFAYCIDAESQTLWKDVPGVLNADPKEFFGIKPRLIPFLSYKQAFEMAYHGASLIHPKTLNPLEKKNINLYIKSFMEFYKKGTIINKGKDLKLKDTCYILKKNQKLVSIYSKNHIFFSKKSNNEIFNLFSNNSIEVNLIQASCMDLNIVVEDKFDRVDKILELYKAIYQIQLIKNVFLYTIFYYDKSFSIENIIGKEKKILIHQSILEKDYLVVLPRKKNEFNKS